MLRTFSRMNSPVNILTKVGGGENTEVHKGDQAKSKTLEIYLQTFCRKWNTSNFNLDFYSTNSVSCTQNG